MQFGRDLAALIEQLGGRCLHSAVYRAAGGDLVDAEVVWYRLGGRLDVALLEVSGPGRGLARRRRQLRWDGW